MSREDGKVPASPTKEFFVKMLTRDIDLLDAILDLLDNCIDGAIRSTREQTDTPGRYEGFWAKLNFNDGIFSITDNCGGIDPELAEHAFMLGRPNVERDSDIPTVGMYGIGMKRALFKMGRSCSVTSQTTSESFKVTISSDWLSSSDDWFLPYDVINAPFAQNGTSIIVDELYPGIDKELFGESSVDFFDNLRKAIATHYCFISHKGFVFYLNDVPIPPVPLTLLFDEHQTSILPYVYEGDFGEVKVSLAVGFLGQAPTDSEVEENLDQQRRSSEDAGWTIICNDRVVVYKDKSRLTGWGVGRVPGYHTQFITISGVVEFRSNRAEFLPVTTTKRGIDASSDLFLRVKDFMMEGTKLFTNHTNNWKQHKEEEATLFDKAISIDVRDIPNKIPAEAWTSVRGGTNERKFMPALPTPEVRDPTRQIRFSRPLPDIKIVAEYLFEDSDTNPSTVGSECFDLMLRKAKENLI